MKITSYLARFAAGALAAFALAVAAGVGGLALFSLSAGAILLMSAVRDYAPRRTMTHATVAAACRCRESMPLAA